MKPGRGLTVLWPLVAAKLALQLLCIGAYGYFRDELYYLACARRLAWGYVDHPPLSIAVLAADVGLLGDSRFAIRLVPALAGCAVVFVSGWLARELGGGTKAMVLAALAALVAPEYLGGDHVYSMNALDRLFWTVAIALLARLLREPGSRRAMRLWVGLGVVVGLGLLNKASVLWLVGGVGVGLVLTPHRRLLVTPGPWLAAGIATVILAPHVLWQIDHGWPTREFVKHATEDKMVAISPLAFFREQIDNMQPLTALLWLPGLAALLGSRRLATFRPVGILYVAVFVLLVVNQKSRAGYLAPAYPVLFAAGATQAELWLAPRRWLPALAGALLVVCGAATAPFGLPVLPVQDFAAYASVLGQKPQSEEKKDMGALPQFYSDMFGWREMTDAVASVALSLSPEDRARAVILTGNYGEAGALELFGRGRGLPPVVSAHNSYWWWGPGNPDAEVVIRLSGNPEAPKWYAEQFEQVEVGGTHDSEWAMPYERHLTIYVCRHPKQPWGAQWGDRKHYD